MYFATHSSTFPFTSQTCTLWGVCISAELLLHIQYELHSYSSPPLTSWTLSTPQRKGRVRVRKTLLGGIHWQTTAR